MEKIKILSRQTICFAVVLLIGLGVLAFFSFWHSASPISPHFNAAVIVQPAPPAGRAGSLPFVTGANWAPDTILWSARSEHSALSFNNKLWVMAGHLDDSPQSSRNDVWSSSNGTLWNLVASHAGWGPRYGIASTVFNGKMWILGGYCFPACSGQNITNEVWSSSDGVTWTQSQQAPPWPARFDSSALTYNNKLWIMGGNTFGGFLNDVWSFDGLTWTQATSSAAWSPRVYPAVAVNNGKMWLPGGAGAGGDLNDVYSSTDGMTWAQATSNPGWTARVGLALLSFQNKLWVMGGVDNCGQPYGCQLYRNDVWSSSDGISWAQVTPHAEWGGRSLFGAVVHNNAMWVLGGYTYDNSISNSPFTRADVWHSP